MEILICGLGLIGGSFAKAIKQKTKHTVFGCDINKDTLRSALSCGAIDGIADKTQFARCDLIILAMYPAAEIDFVKNHLADFKKDAVLVDTCGIKTEVCREIATLTRNVGLSFLGGHPMAGIERSGFEASFADLFCNASMILCDEFCESKAAVSMVEELCLSLGFGRITKSTCSHHDEIIAFTSQLAHVVSSAYIQGELATEYSGFSAGSFKDMTRVARINPQMWTELFFANSENLSKVIGELIGNLQKYKDALDCGDKDAMYNLLYTGNQRKIKSEEIG